MPKEPKDILSDEWYAWRKAKDEAAFMDDPLKRGQGGGEDADLAPYREVAGLDAIVGGTIVDIGFHPAVREGGMTIEYVKDGVRKRMVFGYTDLGLWVEWNGEVGSKTSKRASPARKTRTKDKQSS